MMDKAEYHQKCCGLFQPLTYLPLPKDQTPKVERRVTDVLTDLKNKKATLFYRLKPSMCKNSQKTDCVCHWVSNIQPYQVHNFHHIPSHGPNLLICENSKHFSNMVSSETVGENEVMVSFDVQSLFTNVPIGHALEVIHKRLVEDQTLEDRTTLAEDKVTLSLKICLVTTYFVYRQQHYEQTDGAAMGSPVSPVVANIFMEHIEEIAIQQSPSPIWFWKRYVNDTFCFLRRSPVDRVLNHLNSISPSITFTVEQEMEGKIPFLDTFVTREENRTLKVGGYCKSTYMDRYMYLPFESHHPFHVERRVVHTLVKRAEEAQKTTY